MGFTSSTLVYKCGTIWGAIWGASMHSISLSNVIRVSHLQRTTRNLQTAYQISAHLSRRRDITKSFIASPDDDQVEWVPGSSEKQDLEDFVEFDDKMKSAKLAEAKRSQKHSMKFIKSKIIEQKYFRPTPSSNILSWKAKEQIRYLCSCSSDEEDMDSILEIFPISKMELKSLLKYKKLMKDETEIEKHDQLVIKKWKQLLEPTENLPPSLKQKLDMLKESGQISLLKNAAGAKDIPELGSPTLSELAHNSPAAPGKLTNLLMKHGDFQLRSSTPKNVLTNGGAPQTRAQLSDGKEAKQPDTVKRFGEHEHIELLGTVIKMHCQNSSSSKSSALDIPSGNMFGHKAYDLENTVVNVMSESDSVPHKTVPNITRRGKDFVDENNEVIFSVP